MCNLFQSQPGFSLHGQAQHLGPSLLPRTSEYTSGLHILSSLFPFYFQEGEGVTGSPHDHFAGELHPALTIFTELPTLLDHD